MPVSIELFAIGDPELKPALREAISQSLARERGEWRVSVVGSQSNDVWELKIVGPNVERTYSLYGTEGQHSPHFVRNLLSDTFTTSSTTLSSMPPAVRESWARLSESGGSTSDIEKVLRFTSQNWGASISDRRAFDQFLISQGVNQKLKALSAQEQARFQVAFEKEVRERLEEVHMLVRGVAQGPLALDFFGSLSGTSTEFKQLAYSKGLRSTSGENRPLILCALSREASDFIHNCLPNFPGDPVIDTFRQFLRVPGELLTFNGSGTLKRVAKATDLLFQIVALRIPDQHREISGLSTETLQQLISSAQRLFRTVPNDSFGKLIKLRTAVFLCLADPRGTETIQAKEVLASTANPVVVEVFSLMPDKAVVADAFDQVQRVEQSQSAYAAALVDSLRLRNEPVLLRSVEKLKEWSKTNFPVLSVSAQAALLSLGIINSAQFERTFLKAARSDKANLAAVWLTENQTLLEALKLGSLPHRTWKTLLSSFVRTEPAGASALIQAKLKGDDAFRYWQEGIEALAGADVVPESLFDDLLLQGLEDSFGPERVTALRKEPVRSLIRQRYWRLAQILDETKRIQLLNVLHTEGAQTDMFSLVETGLREQNPKSVRQWVVSTLIPNLLEKGDLAPGFESKISDSSLRENIAINLASTIIRDWEFLKRIPEEWHSCRAEGKRWIAHHLRPGLQAAISNSRSDSPLYSGLEQLSNQINQWIEADTPRLEAALDLASTLDEPAVHQTDRSVLESLFQTQPKNPHSLALFIGRNPWSLQYLFHERGPWPNMDVISAQICKTFVFVAGLRQRAAEQLTSVREVVLIDLAVAIRNTLSDLESELAGFFVFRSSLEEIGIHPTINGLGVTVKENELSGKKHRLLREPGRTGRLRIFSSGVRVGDKVIDTATVMKSGVEDDRD